jgi:hypothetical protein
MRPVFGGLRIRLACRHLQSAASRYTRLRETFDPNVVGSISNPPIEGGFAPEPRAPLGCPPRSYSRQ